MVGAWATGGKVTRVVPQLPVISRTDVSPNPQPHAVMCGPVVDSLIPLVISLYARLVRLYGIFLLRIIVGFWPLANGIYLGVGSFNRVGDLMVLRLSRAGAKS